MKWRISLFLLAFSFIVTASTHAVSSAAGMSPYITRIEAIGLIVESQPPLKQRMEWYKTHMPPLPLFADTQQKQWYAPYVEAAFESGLLSGNADGSLSPGGFLTNAQAITFAAHLRELIWPAPPVFLSVDSSHGAWFEAS